ncbi:MAG: Rieske (2Fe-2S) protein [Candidatus Velamenicoccus archaeovorus]
MQAEGEWVVVLGAAELPEGKPVKVTADGTDVLVYLRGEHLYAIADRCTHQGAPLHRGIVRQVGQDPVATCPVHGSQFRLTDGTVVRGPASTPVRAFEARLNGDVVEVRPRA